MLYIQNIGFDNQELVKAAKSVDASYVIATNFIGDPPPEADMGVHFSNKVKDKPYVESEGVPENAPGGYWGAYSKEKDPNNYYKFSDYYNYINVGVYTDEMKANQKEITINHLDNGYGYLLASTWLQARPSKGPNHNPGGYGTKNDPGIKWWLEFIKTKCGAYSN